MFARCTSLTGLALDFAVAQAFDYKPYIINSEATGPLVYIDNRGAYAFNPALDKALMLSLIDAHLISIQHRKGFPEGQRCQATMDRKTPEKSTNLSRVVACGKDTTEAACRAILVSLVGIGIDLPEEIINAEAYDLDFPLFYESQTRASA